MSKAKKAQIHKAIIENISRRFGFFINEIEIPKPHNIEIIFNAINPICSPPVISSVKRENNNVINGNREIINATILNLFFFIFITSFLFFQSI